MTLKWWNFIIGVPMALLNLGMYIAYGNVVSILAFMFILCISTMAFLFCLLLESL